MQFRIITPAEGGALLADSEIHFKTAIDRAYVHFAECAGIDFILVAPRGAKDVLLISEGAKQTHPRKGSGHVVGLLGGSANMHEGCRRIKEIIGAGSATPDAPEERDPSADYVVIEG